MAKVSMKTITLVAVLMTSAAATSATGAALSGDALRSAVSDKTVVLNVSGFQLPIRYAAKGTMTGRMSTFAAAFSGNRSMSDHGKWWVDGDKLCQKWSSWMDGQTYCYALTRSGDAVRWVRNDGRSGTARIAG